MAEGDDCSRLKSRVFIECVARMVSESYIGNKQSNYQEPTCLTAKFLVPMVALDLPLSLPLYPFNPMKRHATKSVTNKFFFSIFFCLFACLVWRHFLRRYEYEFSKVCEYLWCYCWIRCRCWATFCSCAFSCSSSLASSAFNCGKEYYDNVAHSHCQCMLRHPSKFHVFNHSTLFSFWFRSFISTFQFLIEFFFMLME